MKLRPSRDIASNVFGQTALRTAATLATIAALATACSGRASVPSDDPSKGTSTPGSSGPSGSPGGSSPDGGGASTPAGADAGGNDGSAPSFVPLSGAQTLIDLFVVADGAIVVTSESVLRVDRTGAVRSTWKTPREITAAAFDGAYLGVADKAALSTLDLSFNLVATTFLTETCAAAVMVSGARFVCGPAIDWDRPFYVYDLSAGKLLAKSGQTFTYQGTAMQRIPETDDFLTEENGTFYLYRVDPEGAPTYVGQSNDFGQVAASATIAFIGSPVDHLLTDDGVLFALNRFPPDAGTNAPALFVRDGTLGTLGNQQTFAALDLASTDVVGLVADAYSSCATGCALQRVRVATRTIASSRAHAITADHVVLLRHDATANAAWIGTSSNGAAPGGASGYRIDLVAY